jgi:hypothetical protein
MEYKMKIQYFFLITLIGFIACNDDNSSVMVTDISTQFKLYDTNGVEKTVFKSGEDFEMKFILFNLSGEDLTYHYTGVPVYFEIYQNDSIVATSYDGLSFPQVVLEDKVVSGKTFTSNWIAPNSIARNPKLALTSGNYKAIIKHFVFFDKFQIRESLPIEFLITN